MENDCCPNDETFLSGEALKALAEKLPTPFYLYDEAGIRSTARLLREAFAWHDGYREYFPLRMTPNAAILKLLREEGCGVTCCSSAELSMAEACGFRGDLVLYDTMFPSPDALSRMKRLGAAFVADSLESVMVAAECGVFPEKAVLRYNPGAKLTCGSATLARPERAKLGMGGEELTRSLAVLRRGGVRRFGLAASLIKQTLDPRYYAAVAKLLIGLADELKTSAGISTESCDLGGGAGLGFLAELADADIRAMGELTRSQVMSLGGPRVPELHTEIGRYLTGRNGILAARVLAVKESYRSYLILDAGGGNFIRPQMNCYHHISIAGKTRNAGRRYYDVVGIVPDLADRFGERRLLPPAEAGDLCVIHDAGFCGSALESGYGGAQRCAEYLWTPAGEARRI